MKLTYLLVKNKLCQKDIAFELGLNSRTVADWMGFVRQIEVFLFFFLVFWFL
jgi:hypothetical protein